eukprot:1161359-Pelagomonas_calceolata.AAC.1
MEAEETLPTSIKKRRHMGPGELSNLDSIKTAGAYPAVMLQQSPVIGVRGAPPRGSSSNSRSVWGSLWNPFGGSLWEALSLMHTDGRQA